MLYAFLPPIKGTGQDRQTDRRTGSWLITLGTICVVILSGSALVTEDTAVTPIMSPQ